ncbi:MAG: IPT/TIG domain-containing protein [Methanospirillum sp.]|uniref:IPT/TIG domain-containing protein n=1 Tax=Methanospirillum sp. TaxID=45200 RepID=UPI0023703B9F|nr:IPT/TIG domain-containing protein [Methanospirillum sp.]MDD1727561.1 IPT/TIG domain-containing protein [Methanospirillum sp.]
MDRKMLILAALLACCLIIASVSAANTTKVVNSTTSTKQIKPVQSVNTTAAVKVLVKPAVSSITPNSGMLGTKAGFNVSGSDFDKTAKVYLEMTVMNQDKVIAASKNTVISDSLINGTFKIPTGVPTGDWNVVVKQKGQVSTSSVKYTIKE